MILISLAGNLISWQSTGGVNSTPAAHTFFSCTVCRSVVLCTSGRIPFRSSKFFLKLVVALLWTCPVSELVALMPNCPSQKVQSQIDPASGCHLPPSSSWQSVLGPPTPESKILLSRILESSEKISEDSTSHTLDRKIGPSTTGCPSLSDGTYGTDLREHGPPDAGARSAHSHPELRTTSRSWDCLNVCPRAWPGERLDFERSF